MQRQMCKTRDYPCEDGLFVLLTSLRDPHSLTHSDIGAHSHNFPGDAS